MLWVFSAELRVPGEAHIVQSHTLEDTASMAQLVSDLLNREQPVYDTPDIGETPGHVS